MPAASADLRELAADLAAASGQSIETAAANVIKQVAADVQTHAAASAPRKTGRLSASIQVTWVSKLEAVIGPSVPYGLYQEFGTATRGEFPGQAYNIRPKSKPYLVFQINGRTVVARKVKHPGVHPQPFMRPAIMRALEPFTERLAARGQLLIVKGPRSAL